MELDREELLDYLKSHAWHAAGCVGLLFLGCHFWTHRAVSHPPGVLVPEDPLQGPPDTPAPWEHKGYRFIDLATFEVKARVLGRERYRFDACAEISPIDLALGWGPMSDSAVLDEVSIRQSDRFYFWSVSEFPIPQAEIASHSANMHFIPATELVKDQLLSLRVGQVAAIGGHLVRIEGPGGFHWTSSLTRQDSGDGACEVIWAESVTPTP